MNAPFRLFLGFVCIMVDAIAITGAEPMKLGVFDVDATPPIGSRMFYDPVRAHGELPLRCRGVVLLGKGQPMVLCAMDWIAVNNEAHDAFREAFAKAAGTVAKRVAVHSLHQHDAPGVDFTTEKILRDLGSDVGVYDGSFARDVMQRASQAIQMAIERAEEIEQIGYGEARVEKVASNRRIPGPDGKIRAVRYTACPDPALRAEPEGVIDPVVSIVSFWRKDRPIALLSYYATHPQSYYRTGIPSSDIPGLARLLHSQAVPDALHVHFNGAGGNIGAGKYNDGSPSNRPVLANRLFDGLRRAWTNTQRSAISSDDVEWRVESVALPPASHLVEKALVAGLAQPTRSTSNGTTDKLAWLRRCQSGNKTDISALRLGNVQILHMPGELFVEYQLAAKKMRPDRHVVMAAYGDTGMWYIGTKIAYSEGGYETQPTSSLVAPECEELLLSTIGQLLK